MLSENQIYCGNCLKLLDEVEPHSVSLILCDLPFGMTHNKWDAVIPMHDYIVLPNGKLQDDRAAWLVQQYKSGIPYNEAIAQWDHLKEEGLWSKYKKVLAADGAVILFAAGNFTTYLEHESEIPYRYDLIWKKTQPVGFLNARRMPLRSHETMCVFYFKLPTYNPQKTGGHMRKTSSKEAKEKCSHGTNYGNFENTGYDSTERFPTSVWQFPSDKQTAYYHATQKPIALCRELVKTYSNPGGLVLDNCMGSGTTCLAAILEKRNYIGMEYDPEIFAVAQKRLEEAVVAEEE